MIDVPAPLHRIVDQQRFLVLDTLRFRFILVFVLLTQPCIDCTKDMLHLLKGVTAPLDRSTRAATRQEIIWNPYAAKTQRRDHLDSSFVSHTVMACWMMVLIGDLSLDCRCSVKIKVGFFMRTPPGNFMNGWFEIWKSRCCPSAFWVRLYWW